MTTIRGKRAGGQRIIEANEDSLAKSSRNGQLSRAPGMSDLPAEVLALILQELSFKRKITSRLVCKAWNTEICQLLKSNVICKLHVGPWGSNSRQDRSRGLFEDVLTNKSCLELPTLVHEIEINMVYENWIDGVKEILDQNPKFYPCIKQLTFGNFYCCSALRDDHSPPEPEETLLCAELFAECSPNLTHLNLARYRTPILLRAFSQKEIVFPELLTLNMVLECPRELKAENDPQMCANTLFRVVHKILRTSSNLRTLQLTNNLKQNIRFYGQENLLSSCPQIEHLQLSGTDNGFSLGLLTNAQLPSLKTLALSKKFDRYSEQEINLTLAGISGTLEFLEINCDNITHFPRMPNLKYLHMGNWSKFSLITNIGIYDKLPALKELRVHTLDLKTLPNLRAIRPHPGLVKMEVVNIKFVQSHTNIAHRDPSMSTSIVVLTTAFPHLKCWSIAHPDLVRIAVSATNAALLECDRLVIEELTCFYNDESGFPESFFVLGHSGKHVLSDYLRSMPVLKGVKRLNLVDYPFNGWTYDMAKKLFPDLQVFRQYENLDSDILVYTLEDNEIYYWPNGIYLRNKLLRSLGSDIALFSNYMDCRFEEEGMSRSHPFGHS